MRQECAVFFLTNKHKHKSETFGRRGMRSSADGCILCSVNKAQTFLGVHLTAFCVHRTANIGVEKVVGMINVNAGSG